MASQESQTFHAGLRELAADRELVAQRPLVERREGMGFGKFTAEPEAIDWRAEEIDGITAVWSEPEGVAGCDVLMYLHGGGYVFGSAWHWRKLTGHLACHSRRRVLCPDYRLAPEHPHPAALLDSVRSYRWLLDMGYSPRNIAFAGDSAGGGLVLTTLLMLREEKLEQPAAAVCLSPWTDLACSGDSMTSNAEVDLVANAKILLQLVAQFAPEADVKDPLVSPLYGDYSGICPLYLQVGGDEVLLDDSVRLASVAEAAGVDVTLDVYPEMQHVFQVAAGNLPEADEALDRIGRFLQDHLA